MKLKKYLNRPTNFILTGLINFVLFHYAIYRLFVFLYDSSNNGISGSFLNALLINSMLTLFFTIPHSLLLVPSKKTKLLRYIPTKLYSTFYSLHACLAIVLMDQFWVTSTDPLFTLHGWTQQAINILYGASWIAMFWSMLATGLFRQSGIEEWWHAINKKTYRKELPQTGPYQLCRQPIYASFLGMIWFSPHMSMDRLILAFFWTAYIIWGATEKEKRLVKNKGYQQYATNIPAFPFIPKRWDNFITKKIMEVQ